MKVGWKLVSVTANVAWLPIQALTHRLIMVSILIASVLIIILVAPVLIIILVAPVLVLGSILVAPVLVLGSIMVTSVQILCHILVGSVVIVVTSDLLSTVIDHFWVYFIVSSR